MSTSRALVACLLVLAGWGCSDARSPEGRGDGSEGGPARDAAEARVAEEFPEPADGTALSPAFDCGDAEGAVEELICATPRLAALDTRLDSVWTAGMERMASGGAATSDLDLVRAEQRGWIAGRNDCWKADDVLACTESAYQERIAVLEAAFALVAAREPTFWICEDQPANEFVVTFFETDPRSARVERGDQQEVFLATPAASGSRYRGAFGKEAWFKGDEAMFVWPQTDTLSCRLR
jgi:uncharacterized protein